MSIAEAIREYHMEGLTPEGMDDHIRYVISGIEDEMKWMRIRIRKLRQRVLELRGDLRELHSTPHGEAVAP